MRDLTAAFHVLRRVLAAHGFELNLIQGEKNETVVGAIKDLGLPVEVVEAYSAGGPALNSAIPWVTEQMFLFSLGELVAAQDGYRWSGPERRRLPAWPERWVVIASVFGDPFFVDTGEAGLPVYFSRHGAGPWAQHRVAPSIDVLVEVLATFESVFLGEFDGEVWNQGGLSTEFMDRLRVNLAEQLEPEDVSNFLKALG